MEQQVFLTRFRTDDQNFSVLSFNKDGVTVSQTTPGETPSFQHRNRQSSPQISTAVEVTSTPSLFSPSNKTVSDSLTVS